MTDQQPLARSRLGVVLGGSLKEGLQVRLDPLVSVEQVAVGRYVIIEGEEKRFFGLISDIQLGALNERGLAALPALDDEFRRQVWTGSGLYGCLTVVPALALDRLDPMTGPQPVKTVPRHFATVLEASEEDVAQVFGSEGENYFAIGTPVEMETKVCLDLARVVERSVGVFGKSGTGKTFLTRLLLVGLVDRARAANLVFDMHNEYGWEGTSEGGPPPRGLKKLFGPRVKIVTLDEANSRRRRVSWDGALTIGYDEIEPEDIALLAETLQLSQPMIDSVYLLSQTYGERWLTALLGAKSEPERRELAQRLGLHQGSLEALTRKLRRLTRFEFLVEEPATKVAEQIVKWLSEGISVVIEFGSYRVLEAYILVANVLTRRIHDHYVTAVERALGDSSQQKPAPLVITIEEAHKFLDPRVAHQTIFGTIAREMRKYNVTLLIVDQRPSQIDEEVLSQIGTRICCLLDNEKDIEAVLAGAPNRGELRHVLARLETKQQALVFGYAVPMPIVIKTRTYDESFYRDLNAARNSFGEISAISRAERERVVQQLTDELRGS
ncbi:MAG: ATP-binding protein [Chloroflexi bacterium]|nr:ATP-binding protein [Chloroflexota bacterium]